MLGWTELYNTKGNEHIPFFDEEYMSGIEFADKISDPVFPVMVHIGAFSNPNDHSDILSTKDFSVSKCELILVIYDTVYAEIYAKSMSLTDRFYSNIKSIAEDITLTEVSPDSTQIIY